MHPILLTLLRRGAIAIAGMASAFNLAGATALVDFGFDEGTGTKITDSINGLGGIASKADNPPTFETASPPENRGIPRSISNRVNS